MEDGAFLGLPSMRKAETKRYVKEFGGKRLMVWLDYSIIRNSDLIRRQISAESELNQRRFSIFGIRVRFGAKSAPYQRRIRADLVLGTVV